MHMHIRTECDSKLAIKDIQKPSTQLLLEIVQFGELILLLSVQSIHLLSSVYHVTRVYYIG